MRSTTTDGGAIPGPPRTAPPSPIHEGDSVGRLLRAWRARRPRTKAARRGGLTQAEVARLVGVSEGWYRCLERGVRRDFSDDFLLRVAKVLDLDAAERLALFLGSVGRTPPADPPPWCTPPLADTTAHLVGRQAPHPCYLSDAAWNITAANAPMTQWFPWTSGPRPNLMRWVLLSPEAREQLVDWHDHARLYVGMLRIANQRDPNNSTVRTLTYDILTADADCRRIWAREHDVAEHRDGHRFRLRLPFFHGTEITVTSHVLLPIQRTDMRFVILERLSDPGDNHSERPEA